MACLFPVTFEIDEKQLSSLIEPKAFTFLEDKRFTTA